MTDESEPSMEDTLLKAIGEALALYEQMSGNLIGAEITIIKMQDRDENKYAWDGEKFR